MHALYNKGAAEIQKLTEPRININQKSSAMDVPPNQNVIENSGDSNKLKPTSSNYDIVDEMYQNIDDFEFKLRNTNGKGKWTNAYMLKNIQLAN